MGYAKKGSTKSLAAGGAIGLALVVARGLMGDPSSAVAGVRFALGAPQPRFGVFCSGICYSRSQTAPARAWFLPLSDRRGNDAVCASRSQQIEGLAMAGRIAGCACPGAWRFRNMCVNIA